MNKKNTLLLILVVLAFTIYAQETAQISVSLPLAFPTKDFKEAVDNDIEGVGVGIASNVLFNPKGKNGYSPVFFGVDFSYVTFGRDKQPSTSDTPPYKTTFNYYTINGIARIFLTNKTEGFTPFVDGMLGLKIYNTRTKIDKDLLDTVFDEDQPEVIHTTNDTGLGYGVGIGFYNRKAHGEGEGKGSFTLRVLYLWGDKVEYVKRGSLVIDNGFVNYDTGFTNTNMFMVQLGFMVF
jgi:hypothetical protein